MIFKKTRKSRNFNLLPQRFLDFLISKQLTKLNKFNAVLKILESLEGRDCGAGIH